MRHVLYKCRTFVLVAVASLGVSTVTASAVPINIFSTGLSATGSLLAGGASDSHYTIDEVGGANAIVRTGLPTTYLANDANSQWIWQNANGQPSSSASLLRTFTTTFDLTGLDPTTAVLTGAWGTDNQGLSIFLNGFDTGVAPLLGVITANFASLTNFVISSGFISGLNTLKFNIEDNGVQAGFRAALSGTADVDSQSTVGVVPLPAALPLYGTGLAIMGFIGWRRKRKVAVA